MNGLSFEYDDASRQVLVYYQPDDSAIDKILLGVPSTVDAQKTAELYAWATARLALLGIIPKEPTVKMTYGVTVLRPVNAVTLFASDKTP